MSVSLPDPAAQPSVDEVGHHLADAVGIWRRVPVLPQLCRAAQRIADPPDESVVIEMQSRNVTNSQRTALEGGDARAHRTRPVTSSSSPDVPLARLLAMALRQLIDRLRERLAEEGWRDVRD